MKFIQHPPRPERQVRQLLEARRIGRRSWQKCPTRRGCITCTPPEIEDRYSKMVVWKRNFLSIMYWDFLCPCYFSCVYIVYTCIVIILYVCFLVWYSMCCLLDVFCLISKQDLKTYYVVLADNMNWAICCWNSDFHCLRLFCEFVCAFSKSRDWWNRCSYGTGAYRWVVLSVRSVRKISLSHRCSDLEHQNRCNLCPWY